MKLPGLITVDPHDEELAVQLSNMVGDAFMEGHWAQALLSALPHTSTGIDRERFLARAFILNDIAVAAPYQGCYCLEDGSAVALAYLKSELGDQTWSALKTKATQDLIDAVLSDEETEAFVAQLKKMADVTRYDWPEEESHGQDFIHLVFLAVDPVKRKTGTFRALIEPFLVFADDHQIPCYLETYTDNLVALYEHFDFEVVRRFESPQISLVQRCMARPPLPA